MINAITVPEWKGRPIPFTAKISILPKSVIIKGKIPLNTIPKIIKAVSYTHLDVYKRQFLHSPNWIGVVITVNKKNIIFW